MDEDADNRKKEAELAALRDEAAPMLATASSQGRELTKEEDARVLMLLGQVRSLEEEIHRRVKRAAHSR
jgi:hypothetical protein